MTALAVLALVLVLPARAQEAAKPPEAQHAQPVDAVESSTAERVSRLQGRAYLGRRRDVVGATVTVRQMDDDTTLHLTSTDGKGVFRIEGLADGQYRVRIERQGLEAVIKDEVSVRYPFRAVVELPMQPLASAASEPARLEGSRAHSAASVALGGSVVDAEQKPLNEVQLRLVRADGIADPHIFETGPDGRFAFDELPAGEWLLTITGVGLLPIRTRVTLAHDSRIVATLVRQPASYEPSPLELMPPEEPLPPAVFVESVAPPSPPPPDSAGGETLDD